MRNRTLVGSLVILFSLVGRLSQGVIVPPAKTVVLEWEYPEWTPEIVFNVYHSSSMSVPVDEWPLLLTTTETWCRVPAPGNKHFYTVTASNVISELESER